MIDEGDIESLRSSGWSEEGMYEATALTSFSSTSLAAWRRHQGYRPTKFPRALVCPR